MRDVLMSAFFLVMTAFLFYSMGNTMGYIQASDDFLGCSDSLTAFIVEKIKEEKYE